MGVRCYAFAAVVFVIALFGAAPALVPQAGAEPAPESDTPQITVAVHDPSRSSCRPATAS